MKNKQKQEREREQNPIVKLKLVFSSYFFLSLFSLRSRSSSSSSSSSHPIPYHRQTFLILSPWICDFQSSIFQFRLLFALDRIDSYFLVSWLSGGRVLLALLFPVRKMKVPCCSVCQNKFNEDERCPLLLQCGHCFCRECLSRMFLASQGSSLSCPRCRHVSTVGNSVSALKKNYSVLSLIQGDEEDDDEEDDEDEGNEPGMEDGGFAGIDGICCGNNNTNHSNHNSNHNSGSSSGGGGGGGSCVYSNGSRRVDEAFRGRRIDLVAHKEVKLVRRIGEGSSRRAGVEMWAAVLSGKGCKHKMAVKKVVIGDGTDVVWMQGQLEELRRKSMWCRNVCTFHGARKMDNSLYLVMDRCHGSVQTAMQRNEGRLTLEQILRYGADIARGVAELHAAGVVCMNIKPSNLLLDENGHALVSDYGLPAILKKPDCRKAGKECESPKIHSCMDCTMLSPNYTAPEAWEPVKKSIHLFWDDAIGISPESDAWSFGCTLVEMCTGSIPWAGLSAEEIYQSVVKSKRQPSQYASVVGVGIPMELWKMIGNCLQFKASKRPTFQSMLAIFLRHLQEIPRSPPTSPDKGDVPASPVMNGMSSIPSTDLEVPVTNPHLLHRLVSEGNLDGVRELLSKTASIHGHSLLRSLLEAQNADGQTALHLACRRGSVELVEAILQCKEANVDVLDKDGDPPLVFALAAGSPECVRALIKCNANVRSRLREGLGPSVAHVCAYHGQPDCMRELLLAGADPNVVDDEGESVLHRAVTKKYTDCAIVILENGGCVSMSILNSKDLTPLHLCVMTCNVAVVKRWLELATEEVIDEAIDIQSPQGTALCMAASLTKDHESEGRELVKILLAAGADPMAQDPCRSHTALHIAAMANDVELVRVILEAGVDVNITNCQNTIPLHMALARGAKSCVGLLLSAGANCNMQDSDGDNAFHIAADGAKMIRENLDWILVMLRYPNAAVNVRNHSGKTFLDSLEALPREWISEDLMEALVQKGVHLSPTVYQVGDWVKYRKCVTEPTYGWQGASHKSVGFVQKVLEDDNLIVSFCSGESQSQVRMNEVVKVIPLDRGQHVQLKSDVTEPRFGWRDHLRDSIGTVLCVDDDGILRVGFPGASRGWKADPAEMERVEEFKVGDWVRVRPTLTTAKHGLGSVTPGSVGVVWSIRPDKSLLLELCYLPAPWLCEPEEAELVEPFKIGDRVCVKRSVAEPRYAWGGETHHSVGKISEIENDGLLVIQIPNRPIPWQADPSDMEKLDNFKVGDWVRVKSSVPSPKYGWEDVTRNSIGIIHSLEEDGDVGIAFCFRSKLFSCSVTDVEKAPAFELGQEIRMMPSVTQPRLGWSNETPASIGKIVRVDMDGALNVKVSGRHSLWKVSPGDAEKLPGFKVGDWVRSKPSLGARPSYDWGSIGKEGLAIVHSVQETGYLELACCFWRGKSSTHYTEVEKVPGFKVGQHVKFRAGLVEPRWGWRGAQPISRGVIISVSATGEVRVAFSGLQGLWRGDPADLEIEQTYDVGEWVKLRDGASTWKSVLPGSVGVVQGLVYEENEWNGNISVGFCGEQELWVGSAADLEKVERLVVGQRVKVRTTIKQPRFGWSGHSHASVGIVSAIDADGKLRIYTPAGSKVWLLDPTEVVVVAEREVRINDWVRVKGSVSNPTHHWGDASHASVGVVHRMEDEDLWVAFCFTDRLWLCKVWEMERVRAFRVGDRVKIKGGLVSPRWGWGMETHASRGEVVGVDANGKLRIKFKWREERTWIGDPADIELDG
ncbi:E3 ubiquitin-protein ligase KEG [Andrographis paniculata]|uniref:E3 ubiquitin-protein ligase KEG n=1 Tax=Andrographis paniculata TaxID=175694 RepID=UPI0021E7853A|nr:E3 ubiquitin-protein ligase KEG [Andrographis paniculata]